MTGEIRGRTHSPFSRRAGSNRRFGISKQALAVLDNQIEIKDATADQLREKHPDLAVHGGNKETLEESRFGWLKKRRQG